MQKFKVPQIQGVRGCSCTFVLQIIGNPPEAGRQRRCGNLSFPERVKKYDKYDTINGYHLWLFPET